MATAQLDVLDSGETGGAETKGQIETLTRTALITGLTSTGAADIVAEMLEATGLPTSGSTITVSGNTLYLEERRPKLIQGEQTKGEVVLVYNRRENSSASDPDATPTLRGGTSLKQISTQKDRDGFQIVVGHTWAADDPRRNDPEAPVDDNGYEEQGGELSVMVPMSTLYGEFTYATNTPGAITKSYAGYVNSSSWQGGAKRTWMCTEATFDLVDQTTTPKTYRFAFTFENDDQTWDNDTTAVFIDPRTGKVPPDAVVGTDATAGGFPGIRQVKYYPERDFNDDF